MATGARDFSATEPHEEQEKIHGNGDDHSSKADTSDDRQGSMAIEMGDHEKKKAELGNDDKYEITEDDCADELGFAYPSWKKWSILSVIFIVQVRSRPFIPGNVLDIVDVSIGIHELQHQSLFQCIEGDQPRVRCLGASSTLRCHDLPCHIRIRMRAVGAMV
jgi:hypothetical protein